MDVGVPRSGSVTGSSAEDMKARVMSRIKDTTSKANISNIFNRKKWVSLG